MDNQELVSRTSAGDHEAFRILVNRYAALVRSVCRRSLGDDPALTDDAAQAVFVLLHRKIGSIRNAAALPAWLHRTALRACGQARRGKDRRIHRERQAGAVLAQERAVNGDDDSVWNEIRPHLDAVVADLRPAQRDAVIGFYLQGKSQAAVAKELGCSEAAVGMRLQYALERMRVAFAKRGLVPGMAALAVLLAATAQADAAEPPFVNACVEAPMGGGYNSARVIADALEKSKLMAIVTISSAAAAVLLSAGYIAWVCAANGQPAPTPVATTGAAPTTSLTSAEAPEPAPKITAPQAPTIRPALTVLVQDFDPTHHVPAAADIADAQQQQAFLATAIAAGTPNEIAIAASRALPDGYRYNRQGRSERLIGGKRIVVFGVMNRHNKVITIWVPLNPDTGAIDNLTTVSNPFTP